MATSNNRDVKMTLSVETLGSQEISKLESSLRELAKQGGDAAPEFERLANEVSRLGQQSEAITAMARLSEAIADVGDKQQQAVTTSQRLQVEYEAAKATTNAAAEAQREVVRALGENQKAINAVAGEISVLKSQYDAAGKKTDEYQAAIKQLTDKKTELKNQTIDLKAEQKAANAELEKAVAAEEKLASSYGNSVRAVESLSKNLNGLNTELDAARTSATDLGAATTSLTTAQTQLLTQLNAIGTSAQGMRTSIEAAAAAERELDQQAQIATQRLQERMSWAQRSYNEDQQLASARIADAARVAAAEEAAAQQVIAARRAEQAESDRLYEIQRQSRERLELAGKQALAAEMAAQREAADLVKRLEAEKLQAIEASARKQADAINNAFSTVGVRGAADLRAEIAQVRASMDVLGTQAGLTGRELRTAMDAGNAKIKELERELRAVTGEMTLADKAAGLLKNSMGQIAAGNIIADGVGYLVNKVKELGRAFIDVTFQAESTRKALNAIYKDTNTTAQQIQFLRDTATAAGVSISGITDDFVRFSAATKSSGISLQATNDLFRAVTMAASSLGLGADKTGLALNALGQIASKSVVSMEELRQQLGDAIPGALSLTAKGLGITDAELVKLVESGNLAARDFFPAFTKGLAELQGETDGLRQSWERLKNSLTISAQFAADAGATEVLSGAIRFLSGVLQVLIAPLYLAVEGVGQLGRIIGILTGAVLTLTNPMSALGDLFAASGARLKALGLEFGATIGIVDRQTAANARLAVEQLKVAQSTADQTTSIAQLQTGLSGALTLAQQSTVGQQALAVATKIAGDASLDAGAKWVQLNNELGKIIETAKNRVAVAEKEAKAADVEAGNLVALAKLRGDSAIAIQAETDAANIRLTALQTVAQARSDEAAAMTVQLNEQLRLAAAEQGGFEARKVIIEQLQKKVEVANAEALAARNSAEASKVDAEQKRIAAEAYKDNSDQVERYAAMVKSAKAILEGMIEAEKQGVVTKGAVRDAELRLAGAVNLYNDTMRDRAALEKANTDVLKENINIRGLAVKVAIEQQKSILELAKIKGDEYAAIKATNEIKKLEIELVKLTAEGKRLEAAATMTAAEATRADKIAKGEWNAAAEAQYQLSLKKAEALNKEAEISEITAKRMEDLAKATKLYGTTADGAAGSSGRLSRDLDGVSTSADKAADSLNRLNRTRASGGGGGGGGRTGGGGSGGGGAGGGQKKPSEMSTAELESYYQTTGKYQGPSANDPYNAELDARDRAERLQGNTGWADNSGMFLIADKLDKGALTAQDAELAKTVLDVIENNLRVSEQGSAASISLAGRNDDAKWSAYATRLRDWLQTQGIGTGAAMGRIGAPNVTPRGSTQGVGGTVRTLRLQIGNGPATDVNMASSQDAAALESFLSQLESSSGRST